VLKGKNNEEKIWNYLRSKKLTECGAAALMGNLFAESGFKSTNLENGYEKKLGYTDVSYTEAVDNGSYDNFIKDSAGYGIAQWTHWSRKEKLLECAKSRGSSIGDLEMQLEFLIRELEQSFSSVISLLRITSDLREASDCVLLKFERPADQSETAKKRRAEYGQKYYDMFVQATDQKPEEKEDSVLQLPTIPTADASANYTTYVVKRGDTLTKIAAAHSLTYKELAAFNGLSNPNLIKVGQVIKIPKGWTPKIGDVVMFHGPGQYYSPNSIFGKPCKHGKAKIAEVRDLGKSKHPYRLQYIPGGGSDVTKWVDEGTFTKM
jgi:LysM repeat protein